MKTVGWVLKSGKYYMNSAGVVYGDSSSHNTWDLRAGAYIMETPRFAFAIRSELWGGYGLRVVRITRR